MADRQKVDKERLGCQNGVHGGIELGQHRLQHLIDVSWMIKALGGFGYVQVQRRKIDRMSCESIRVRE